MITVNFDVENHRVYTVCEGVLVEKDFYEIYNKIFNDSRFDKDYDSILDLSKVTDIKLTDDASFKISKLLASKRKDSNATLIIITHDISEFKYGLEYMKQIILRSSLNFEVKLVHPDDDWETYLNTKNKNKL